ncbi:MAG TPA: metallophosphoesterase [Pirellulales bacterium]|jgi:DNA repair exonuclease SbcCD nuclease subunit
MLERPFRFLHAADLHIDGPAVGADDAPVELVDRMIDCGRQAAIRVFDAALAQRVDFVVLAGDVVDSKYATPRDWLFLVEQFQRMAERNIVVYWCGGSVDRQRLFSANVPWPAFVEWPANVRFFSAGQIGRYRHEIGGQFVCEIVGRGGDPSGPPKPYEYTPSDERVFSIAVADADWNCAALAEMEIDYWALGGLHQRATPLDAGCLAHYAGTPQGRSATEPGPHGCTLVTVDELRQVGLTPINCDVMRWQSPRLSWEFKSFSQPDHAELVRMLAARTEQLIAEAPGVALMLSWKIAADGALATALRNTSLAAELRDGLRMQFSGRTPPCWALSVEADRPPQIPVAWIEEEAIRGDFLRAIEGYLSPEQMDRWRRERWVVDGLPTVDDLADEVFPDALATGTGEINRARALREVLAEAAWLGSELLSPEEDVR